MTTLATLKGLIDTFGVDVHEHLDREIGIPVSSSMQRQGDIIVIPVKNGVTVEKDVLPGGTPVVRGENGGNTHGISAEAGSGVKVDTFPGSGENLCVATVFVPENQVAWLTHPEHGYMGIGPGTYKIHRQREQADIIRMVAD